jgi:succinyl-diaminopimelate desuccinylase
MQKLENGSTKKGFEKFESVSRLCRELVQINSENPTHNELSLQRYLEAILTDLGFAYFLVPYAPNRNNIVALYPKLSDAESFGYHYMMFSGHMDTVPGYEVANSQEAPIIDGKLYGRGTCDMKGNIAAFLTAVQVFLRQSGIEHNGKIDTQKINRGICIVFTVDEEMGCCGVRSFIDHPRFNSDFHIDFCINGEPSNLHPVIGHKGIVWFILDFIGKAAHASVPQLGDNAIEKATRFINALEPLKQILRGRKVHEYPEINPPTLNVGMIQGGLKTNMVPDQCHVEVDRRLIPGETSESALQEITEILKELGLLDSVKISPIKPGESYIIPNGINNQYYQEISKISSNIMYKNNFQKPETRYFMEGYTEADVYFRYFGIPTLNLGAGSIDQAHKADEYVNVDDLQCITAIYYIILSRYVLKKSEATD